MTTLGRIGLALSALLGTASGAAATPTGDTLRSWVQTHAIALPACPTMSSRADFGAMANMIGDARVVALGEPVHGAHEPLAFRNCLFRYLVEEQGFTAIAIESGLRESRRLHDYAAGAPGDVRDLAQTGLTWGFGRFPENIELIEWIRAYNLDPRHKRKIAFYGIDMSGGGADGAWARGRITLDEGIAYLARAASTKSEPVRKAVTPFLDHFSVPAYLGLDGQDRKRLRRALAEMLRFFDTNRAALIAASSPADYAWARQDIVAARQLQTLFDVSRALSADGALKPDDHRADAARDAAMAENARWALDRAGTGGRMLLFAHNGHIMNARTRGGIWSVYSRPPAAMGVHLRRTLGRDLLIVGASSAGGRGGRAIKPGAIDAVLASARVPHFVIDFRSAAPAWLSRDQSISVNYDTENVIRPRQAFDGLVYFDRLTPSRSIK